MSFTYRQWKQIKRRWSRVILCGSFLGGMFSGVELGIAQTTMPPPANFSGQTTTGLNPALPALGQPELGKPVTDSRLQMYDVPSEFVGTVGAGLQVHYHGNPAVSVTTDPKTGKLMVMAPAVVHQEIAAQINAFMQQHNIPDGDRGINLASYKQQSYTLQNLSWRELEDAVQRLAGNRLSASTERNGEIANLKIDNAAGRQDVMQIDRRQNIVTLLGSGPTVAGWSQVVYSLDQGQVDPKNMTQIVPLAPAEPRRVQRAIQLVKMTIQQDQTGNAQAEERIGLGQDEPTTAMGTLETLSSDSGLFGDVQIEFIEEIDLVIIRGSKRDVQRTLEVIEKIKQQAKETQPEVEVYPLQFANAQAVADLVTELYATIYEPRKGAVSITALGQPNALLLIGRKEVVQSVKDLVSKIDQPLDPQSQLQVIPLLHASSVDLATRIREFFVERPGEGTDIREGLGTRVKILSDYRTNSLIVQAAPREMAEVERLIRELDVESSTAENEVRVFRLMNTLALDLQTVIQEVISGPTEAAGTGTATATPPSGKITVIGPNGPVESGILAGVVVTADPTVNALVVRAPAQSMDLIAQLIKELDQLPSAEAKIKVFPVENGDATQLSATLQQLYGLQVTAGQSTTGGLFGLGTLQQAALTAGGESSLVQLRITPDVRTNSIIVSGGTSDLQVIEALLYRLDIEGVENRRTEVVWLRNATAQNIADAMNAYLQQQRQVNQLLVTTNQAISVFDQVDREVFIVAEGLTNSLILSATPRYFDTILQVIERLDRRPPLVAIQVLIAEIQLDDKFEFGTEWGLQDGLLFDRQSATGGTLSSPVFNLGNPLTGPSRAVGQPDNVAGQALSTFALGRLNADGLGGLVLSASSEAVGVLIRALQTANRLQILSRPQITTMDNQPASTLVGQQVPRVQGVTQAQFGQTINAVDIPVGLGLAVLPRVNQDGLILMQVQVQNSSVGDTLTGIPVGFGPNGEVIRSPIINSTEASTVVSAYSGQTVVFAGLIQKTRTSARRQIPFLGSLPLIGAAFRYDTETEQRRELLVVLTPRIIQTDEEYEVLKQVESARMSWCLADVLNIHGDVGLGGGNGLWGPAKSPVIFPDLQPTAMPMQAMPPAGLIPGYIDGIPIEPGVGLITDPANSPASESSASHTTSGPVFRAASYSTLSAPAAQATGATPAGSAQPR